MEAAVFKTFQTFTDYVQKLLHLEKIRILEGDGGGTHSDRQSRCVGGRGGGEANFKFLFKLTPNKVVLNIFAKKIIYFSIGTSFLVTFT